MLYVTIIRLFKYGHALDKTIRKVQTLYTCELFPLKQFRVIHDPGVKEVNSLYCADLLSWVMVHASANCAWCTVLGNVNSIAVAVTACVSVIILCEGAEFDKDALLRAEQNQVFLVRTGLPVFEAAAAIAKKAGFLYK